jgi:hypothetical protein
MMPLVYHFHTFFTKMLFTYFWGQVWDEFNELQHQPLPKFKK